MLERLGGKKAGGDGWWKGKKKGNKGEEVGRKGMEERKEKEKIRKKKEQQKQKQKQKQKNKRIRKTSFGRFFLLAVWMYGNRQWNIKWMFFMNVFRMFSVYCCLIFVGVLKQLFVSFSSCSPFQTEINW